MTKVAREEQYSKLYLDSVERELGTRDLKEANRRTRVKWEWEMENDE